MWDCFIIKWYSLKIIDSKFQMLLFCHLYNLLQLDVKKAIEIYRSSCSLFDSVNLCSHSCKIYLHMLNKKEIGKSYCILKIYIWTYPLENIFLNWYYLFEIRVERQIFSILEKTWFYFTRPVVIHYKYIVRVVLYTAPERTYPFKMRRV